MSATLMRSANRPNDRTWVKDTTCDGHAAPGAGTHALSLSLLSLSSLSLLSGFRTRHGDGWQGWYATGSMVQDRDGPRSQVGVSVNGVQNTCKRQFWSRTGGTKGRLWPIRRAWATPEPPTRDASSLALSRRSATSVQPSSRWNEGGT